MYIQWNKNLKGKKLPTAILRHSYRENGKPKKKTIANLGHMKIEEIKALELALKHKENLANLKDINKTLVLKQGISFGANWLVYQVARKLGIEKTLGTSTSGKLALWQVISRVVDQGSRLSAVRLARDEASDEIIHFSKEFNEEDLYKNLFWLSIKQEDIEKKLLKYRQGEEKPKLFLYDVTSSYLEGVCNDYANWGYNRDRKRGKMQIVIGLMCDLEGIPISVEVFEGNTKDTDTFKSQIEKVAKRFNCEKVTFVGDKGMIKSVQIEDLQKVDFHYITSITKPQIEKMINTKKLQLGLFDEDIVEVADKDIRYVLRKNPFRAKQIAQTREEKLVSIEEFTQKQNDYLKDHPKAKESVAKRKVNEKISRLKVKNWLFAEAKDRKITLKQDQEKKKEEAKLDGCYCLKTDLKKEIISAQKVHDRYKDLAKVEKAFRTQKTAHLEMRPLYVTRKASTRGHLLVCMLALMITQELEKAWVDLDITVEEGIKRLRTLCTTVVETSQGQVFHQTTKANKQNQQLFDLLDIDLPPIFPKRKVFVDTRKKLVSERK